MNGLAWLNELMTWLGRWVPRLVLVPASHEGVRFGPRGGVRRLLPGLHVYWPILQEVRLVSVAQRALDTDAQVIDGYALTTVVIYRITDAVKVAISFYNFAAQIEAHVKATMLVLYTRATATDDLSAALTRQLRRTFRARGIAIEAVRVTQRTWTIPIKTMSEFGTQEMKELE